MDNKYFMQEAIKEAKKAFKNNEIPVGAVIVKDNKIISKGYNLKEKSNNATKHAEMIAIEEASKYLNNWRLLDCTIYITMFPCPMCASAINQARISKIVYGTIPEYANGKQIKEILADRNYGMPVEIIQEPVNNECAELLIKFFKKKRQ